MGEGEPVKKKVPKEEKRRDIFPQALRTALLCGLRSQDGIYQSGIHTQEKISSDDRKELAAAKKRVKKLGKVMDTLPPEQEADFISCVVFSKGAEFAQKYLRKGMKIAVSGRISTGNYKDKEGRTIYTTDIIVEEHEFAESARDKETSEKEDNVRDEGFMNVPADEELPFE